MDLNHGPPRYKLGALPTELQAEITPRFYRYLGKKETLLPLSPPFLIHSVYDE